MTTKLHEQVDTWFAQYQKLRPKEQLLLQLMSLLYSPLPSSTLRAAAVRIGAIKAPRVHTDGLPDFLKLLHKLESREMLVRASHNQFVPPPNCLEELTILAIEQRHFDALVTAINKVLYATRMIPGEKHIQCDTYQEGFRCARLAFYAGKDDEFTRWQDYLQKQFPTAFYQQHPLAMIFQHSVDLNWFFALPARYIQEGISRGLEQTQWDLMAREQLVYLAEAYAEAHNNETSSAIDELLSYNCLLQGKWDLSQANAPTASSARIMGTLALLQGEYGIALSHFEAAYAHWKESSAPNNPSVGGLPGIFLVLMHIKQGTPASLKAAAQYTKWALKQAGDLQRNSYQLLDLFLLVQENERIDREAFATKLLDTLVQNIQDSYRTQELQDRPYQDEVPTEEAKMDSLLTWWVVHWLSPPACRKHPKALSVLAKLEQKARENGLHWIAAEAAGLLAYYEAATPALAKQSEEFWSDRQANAIYDLFPPRTPWEYALSALMEVTEPVPGKASETQVEERLAWFIEQKRHGIELLPYIQKRNAKGKWTKGRKVSLQHIKDESKSPSSLLSMTPEDLAACEHITTRLRSYYSYYNSDSYDFDEEAALFALVGHPHIYDAAVPGQPIELIKEEARLRIITSGKELSIHIDPLFSPGKSIAIRKESSTRIALIQSTPQLQKIAAILGEGLHVPLQAKDQVLEIIHRIAPLVTVHSDIGGSSEHIEEVTADTRLVVRLWPFGGGLKAELSIRPFGPDGPRFTPGEGGASIFASVNQKQLHTTRQLKEERQREKELSARCPTWAQASAEHQLKHFDDLEDCLNLLLELDGMVEEITIEWPEGKKLQLRAHLSEDALRASLRQENDWFALSGELQVDDKMVMGLRQLMALLAENPGRFLPLGNGEFIALTERFRARLDDIGVFSEKHEDTRRLHPSATFAIGDILDEFDGIRADKAWKQHRANLQKAPDTQVPDDFQGTLREYQVEGFQWLTRLAHWGFGACLADQMGLGKTLQAIALLLHRADHGPALVIAPTSVCANWIDEVHRFGPSIQCHDLGHYELSARQDLIDQLGPRDLLLCSYGLLTFEYKNLQKRTWQTLVLDEAQAIKNPKTKRFKAVSKLPAHCKVITTGTPIENHLGDLWSLFHFLNPGLLGTWNHFQDTFAIPIERGQQPQIREQLKRFVQPFILRRLKQDVLLELPPRTDITLRVEPSQEEAALYEALRQQALENIALAGDNTGQARFQILAELTRMRQACCHPSLALPESQLTSSKHESFLELLEGLLEEGHKALVFSQFVRHLELVKGRLEERKISYQYLDGSTPAKVRKTRIKAFQSGEGDVFLISLKAGGSGINLTEADYVIHMDPWWNPAVEDQASDRAHRIGQKRPVTIYRLIMKGSIEEKIIDLHHHKRDLADSLLDGSELSAKLTSEQLLDLLKETNTRD